MAEERTEEQKVARAPVIVVLGGKDHEIIPLVISESRAWRIAVVAALGELQGHTQTSSDDTGAFQSSLDALLVGMPDKVLDLFFQYAKGLDRPTIEATATDKEVAEAFEKVVALAFPLAQSLVGTMGRLSA